MGLRVANDNDFMNSVVNHYQSTTLHLSQGSLHGPQFPSIKENETRSGLLCIGHVEFKLFNDCLAYTSVGTPYEALREGGDRAL
jgi:hypothetical protein